MYILISFIPSEIFFYCIGMLKGPRRCLEIGRCRPRHALTDSRSMYECSIALQTAVTTLGEPHAGISFSYNCEYWRIMYFFNEPIDICVP
ncbi:hypothetical protein PUN28_014749 [Cardiocondyla obscurior]|uniref:Uncharacterized protein n=1 Tax=Cardiocondyla obscurior TaxID=286306 RepID=A0AAW2EXR7_9HYME